MAALAALLHGGEGWGYLLRCFHALLGDRSQLGYRPAVTIDRLGKALGVGPDLGQRIMLLLGVARLGEVRPGRFDIGRQGLGMDSKGLAIEGQAVTEHAAHRLAVFEERLERRLALAFRRIGIGLGRTANQGQAAGGQQQNFGVWNSEHRYIPWKY